MMSHIIGDPLGKENDKFHKNATLMPVYILSSNVWQKSQRISYISQILPYQNQEGMLSSLQTELFPIKFLNVNIYRIVTKKHFLIRVKLGFTSAKRTQNEQNPIKDFITYYHIQ